MSRELIGKTNDGHEVYRWDSGRYVIEGRAGTSWGTADEMVTRATKLQEEADLLFGAAEVIWEHQDSAPDTS